MIIIYEFLSFGLDKVIEACETFQLTPILFTEDPNYYPGYPKERLTVISINTRDPSCVIDYMKHHFTVTHIKGLINSTDTFSLYAATVATHFGLITNTLETLKKIRNKDILRAECCRLGLPSVKHRKVISYEELKQFFHEVNAPIIIKDANGTGSQDIYKVNTLTDLEKVKNKITADKNWLAEEFIYGTLYSAETISSPNQHQVIGITSRTLSKEPRFQETSGSFPTNINPVIFKKIALYISRLLTGLGFKYGYSHIELMLHQEEPLLIEVNPRLGGGLVGYMMCSALSLNIYEKMVLSAIGENPLYQKIQFDSGCSFVLLYANKRGKIRKIHGLDAVNHFEDTRYFSIKTINEEISFTEDQRANYGIIFARDFNAHMAYNKAHSVSNMITVEMEVIP